MIYEFDGYNWFQLGSDIDAERSGSYSGERNKLALSSDGRTNFDGTAHGQGVRAETSVLVALEPTMSDQLNLGHATHTRIWNRLWCRNKEVAKSWRPYLKEDLSMLEKDGHVYFEPIYIYCEANKTVVLEFEQQQESDGTSHDVCITAIPGVDDHTTLETWNDQAQTVAVSEIMRRLLYWSYSDARQIWNKTPQI